MPGPLVFIYWAFSRHLRQRGGLQGVRLLVNPMKTTILPQMPWKSTVNEDEWAWHNIFWKLHYLSFQMTYQPCSNSFWIVFCDHFSNHKKFEFLKQIKNFRFSKFCFSPGWFMEWYDFCSKFWLCSVLKNFWDDIW